MTPAQLRAHLRVGPRKITFKKADGTTRVMKCTMDLGIVPPSAWPSGKQEVKEGAEDDKLFKVYDLEKSGWRSFKFDTVMTVEI